MLILPHVALLCVQLLFSSFPIAGKEALKGLAPLSLATWRVIGASLALGFIAWRQHPDRFWPDRKSLVHLVVLSLFGVFLNQIFFILGLNRSQAVDAGMIMGLIPVAAYVFAILLGQEGLRARRALGIALAFGATTLLVLGRGDDLGRALGNLLMVANALSYALYLCLAKPLLGRLPPMVVTAWIFILAAPAIIALSWPETWLPAAGDTSTWLWTLWVVLGPTVLAYSVNTWALSRVRASTTAVYIYLQPILTAVGAMIWRGERLGSLEIAAFVGILLGMHLVIQRRQGAPVHATKEAPSGG